jgi:hypothetical protein
MMTIWHWHLEREVEARAPDLGPPWGRSGFSSGPIWAHPGPEPGSLGQLRCAAVSQEWSDCGRSAAWYVHRVVGGCDPPGLEEGVERVFLGVLGFGGP